jgi:hypothetical protein
MEVIRLATPQRIYSVSGADARFSSADTIRRLDVAQFRLVSWVSYGLIASLKLKGV